MLSALGMARRIEAGELTPRAAVALCAQAIAAREKEVGAFAALDLDAARRAAEEPRLASTPLRGLPVAFKDIFDTADFPTQYGSPIYAGHRPRADATAVALTRRAGGNIIGKTVTTEFASMVPSATRNPRNAAHTPGGSSSGSAAAVAAAMAPIAFGTQTAGSVIRPAAFCGVTGFKPSYRLIPMIGVKDVAWHLDTAGLFGAGVADVAFAAAVILERDLRVDGATPSAPRIALVRTHLWGQASAAMQNAVESTASIAQAAGAKVTDVTLPPNWKTPMRPSSSSRTTKRFAPMPSNTIATVTRSASSYASSSIAPRRFRPTPTTRRGAVRAARARRLPTPWLNTT